MAVAKSALVSEPTQLIELDLHTIQIHLEGTSPLITHAWSEKAKKMMLDKQMGKASKGKEKKDPIADYESSFYRMPSGQAGVPLLAFKCAAVTACTSLGKEITKVAARQFFHILPDPFGGDITEIYYPDDCPPRMREDMVRVGMGTADIRFRPEFVKWGVKVRLQFNRRAVTQEQVVNLLNLGGFSVGVGEWRPEKDGDKGRFSVVSKFSWE
jgi:hypothetical protein